MWTKVGKVLSVAGLALALSVSQAYAGNITFAVHPAPDGGTTVPTGTAAYNVGDEIVVTATANPGYKFSEWGVSNDSIAVKNKGSANTTMWVFKAPDATLTAYFVPVETATLTLVPSPAAGGKPTFNVDGVVVRGTWGASTPYVSGQYVRPTLYNGHYYRCTQTGTSMTVEPNWPTDGSEVSDIGGSSQWTAATAYAVNDLVTPVTANGHYYICTVAGTSGAAQPAWPEDGGAVVDNTVTWLDMGAIVTWKDVGMTVTYGLYDTVGINPGTNAAYDFLGWTQVSGSGAINQALNRVTLNSSAVTVQANYEAIPDPGAAVLTLNASPTAALGTVWAASTDYELGDMVQPTTSNGHYYMCTAAGTSNATQPTWPTDGTAVVDNTVTWDDIGYQPATTKQLAVANRANNTVYQVGDFVKQPGTGPFPAHFYRCEVAGQSSTAQPATWPTDGSTVQDNTNINNWAASTAYVIGNLVQPVPANGHYYQCVKAGNSGTSAPSWKTDGTNTSDGTVVWSDRGTIITWRDVGRNPFNVGETVTLAEQHTVGYDLLGWTLGSGAATLTGNQLKFIGSNVSAVANYEAAAPATDATIKLSVDSNKGTVSFPDFNPWTALTAYAVGDIVRPTLYASHYYKCTVAGTSAGAEPVWPTNGTTVNDGTVTWQDVGLTISGFYEVGDIVNIAQAGKAGYTFAGWTIVSGNGSINQAGSTVTANSSSTLEVQANYSTDTVPSAATLTLNMIPSSVAPAWAATTSYLVGQLVIPVVPNGHYYQCTIAGTSGGAEPVWPTDGTPVIDGSVTWLDIGREPDFVKAVPGWIAGNWYDVGDFVMPSAFADHYYRCTTAGFSVNTEPAWTNDGNPVNDDNGVGTWAAATAYAFGDLVKPAAPNGHYYLCSTAGVSGAAAPTWPTDGSNVTDGTATWTDMGAIVVWTDVGMNPFNIGDQFQITYVDITGYDFIGWSVEGGASVTFVFPNWFVKLNSASATVSANYKAQDPDVDATLTLNADPAAAGLPEFDGIAIWAPLTPYALGDIIRPTTYNMHYYQCKVAGTSAAIEPVWPTGSGAEIGDGTITWKEIGTTLPFMVGDNVPIGQTTNAGYTFVGWKVASGTAALYDASDPNNANVTIGSSSVVVTAVYEANHAAVELTVAISPDIAGQVNEYYPAVNSVAYGTVLPITAVANPGYTFSHWQVSGSLEIGDIYSAATNIIVYGATTLTAVFDSDNTDVLLTFEASPDNTGTTAPWQGSNLVVPGSITAVTANPNDGYKFSHWELVSGNCTISNSTANPANVRPLTDATVRAVFEAQEMVTLTLLTDDFSMGTVTNWLGPNEVPAKSALLIDGAPNAGYKFSYWEISGSILIDDIYNEDANVTVFGDASMTAHFTAVQTCTLTLGVSPANSGVVVTPYQGSGTQNTDTLVFLDADPNQGYRFVRWEITSGPGRVLFYNDDGTGFLLCYGDVTATAIFESVGQVALTIGVLPSLDQGTAAPFIGTDLVDDKTWIAIDATPKAGYKFTGWNYSGSMMILDPSAASTEVYLWDDSSVTANFAEDPATVLLTVGVTPDGAGFVDPFMGTDSVGINAPFLVSAAPWDAAAYEFVGWRLESGAAVFDNASSALTNVTPATDAAILAVFKARTQVSLTIAVSPANSGTTHPWLGTETLNAGVIQNIVADAAPGYVFSHWAIVSGSIKIDNPSSNNTNATVLSDASITAVFDAEAPMVNLTLAVSPAGAGYTQPIVGTAEVQAGIAQAISSVAKPGYRFTCWQVTSGSATIDNSLNADANATLLGNATITANFEEFGDVTLTIAISPSGSASSVEPTLGSIKVKVGEEVDIKAWAAQNFSFVGWTLTSGSAAIRNAGDNQTVVKVLSDATVTANFQADVTAALTLQITPAGSCDNIFPQIGATNVLSGEWTEIAAFPNPGYAFSKWTVASGDATVFTPSASSTLVKLSSASVLTAEFEALPALNLTIIADPKTAGNVTVPDYFAADGVFKVNKGQRLKLEANANAGFSFANWEILAGDEGKISVQNLYTQITYVELSDSATLTAHFNTDETAALTLISGNEAMGFIDSSGGGMQAGVTNVPTGEWNRIVATVNDGYRFTGWSATDGGAFFRSQDADTCVMLSTDATVTANFEAVPMALLTLTVSPDQSGFTQPYLGVDRVETGGWIALDATAYDGYAFSKWQVTSGNAVLFHPNEAASWVAVKGDATVTAVFVAVDTVTITAAVDPACSGRIVNGGGNLLVGANVVQAGLWFRIIAEPKDQTYKFAGWTKMEGDAVFENASLADTYVKATKNSLITANFQAKATATLTLAMNPAYAGQTNYFIGANTVPTGEWLALNITQTNDGFRFTNWTVDTAGAAVIENPLDDTTFVKLSGDATISANFAEVPTAVLVTYDGAIKEDFQDIINVGEWVRMPYTAVYDDYIFTGWQVLSGKVEIDQPSILNTWIRVQGDASIVANYAKAALGLISMKVNEPHPGQVPGTARFYSPLAQAWVAADNYYAGQSVVIRANANANYRFLNWTVKGQATVVNSTFETTYATVNGDCEIIANFEELPTALLTMLVNQPDPTKAAGIVTPEDDFYPTEVPIWITANPNAGFAFDGWTATANASIENADAMRTFITLAGDAQVTANFVAVETLELTVLWNPPHAANAGGTTAEGIYYLESGKDFALAQRAKAGYTFKGWTVVSGDATITEVHNGGTAEDSDFSVSITSNAVISADFELAKTGVLTTAVSPAQDLAPGTIQEFKPGTHVVQLNTSLQVTPVANVGYVFTGWTVQGGVQVFTKPIENPGPEAFKDDTLYYIILTGDGMLTANFEPATTVDLAVETDLYAGGWAAGNYGIDGNGTYKLRTGEKIWIWVDSVNEGYAFAGWTISGDNNSVKDQNAEVTYMILGSAGTLTAKFVALDFVPVTFAVLPKGAATISPAAGTYELVKDELYWISVAPANGFAFFQWKAEGGAVLNDVTSMDTCAVFTDAAKVTAELAPVETVTLTLAADPDPDAGGITCTNGLLNFNDYGTYTIETGTWWTITAAENAPYVFNMWQTTENVVIMDPYAKTTTAYLTGDGGITAVYTAGGTAELTIALDPMNTEDTRPSTLGIGINGAPPVLVPGPGTYTIPSNQWVEIGADANFGWKFVKWTATGDLELLRYENHRTQVYMAPGAVGSITALFQEVPTVVMTMVYNPEMGGEGMYGLGEHNVPQNEWLELRAHANRGFKFVQWNIDANAQIAQNWIYDENVEIRLSADSVVQPQFAPADPVEATLAVNPEYAGDIKLSYQGVEVYGIGKWTVDAGKKYELIAETIAGFKFVKWSYTGGAIVQGTYSKETYVIFSADGTVTAEYTEVPTCTLGIIAAPPQGFGTMLTDIPNGEGGNVNAPGTYTVSVGETYTVEIAGYETYRFYRWTSTGDVTIRMIKGHHGCAYEITVAGNATITANFVKNTYAQLTLDATPDGSVESVSVDGLEGERTHTVVSHQWLTAEVRPAAGYRFVKWSTTDSKKIEILSPYTRVSSVYVFDNADLTAELAPAQTAALTVVYDDPKGGEANLSQTTHNVVVGEWIAISASAYDGFYFSGWTVSDGGKIYMNRCDEEETFVMLSADATLTCGFLAATSVNLTLASTPNIGGYAQFWSDANCKVGHGTYAVDANKKYYLQATAYPGYQFSQWTVSDPTKVAVRNTTAEQTSFRMTDSGSITANFVAIPTAQITLAADTEQALYFAEDMGWVTYGGFGLSKDYTICEDPEWCWFHPGTYTLEASKTYLLQVLSVDSYRLAGWSVTDDTGQPSANATVVEVTNYYNWTRSESYASKWYYLTVNGNATVTALFEKRPTAMLTTQIDPAGSGKLGMMFECSGYWDLDVAPVEIYTGIYYNVTAYAAEGYYFHGIIVVKGNATVNYGFDEECFSKAKVMIETDATIRAVFGTTPPTIPYLTLAISNANAGTLTPPAGTYPAHFGQKYSISVTTNPGYVFLYWQADIPANVIIGNVNASSTTATVIGDVTVTAMFTTQKVIPITVLSFAAGLESLSVGSDKPKDSMSFLLELDKTRSDYASGIKIGVDGWFLDITAWTKADAAKEVYYYENAAKTVKITVKKDKYGRWTVKGSVVKSDLYKLIDPTNAVDLYVIVGELKYTGSINPDDNTTWSFKAPDKNTATILSFNASYSMKNEVVSDNNKISVKGQNFDKPAGYDNTVRPVVMVDSATWNVDVAPTSKDADTYLYKSDKALKPYVYQLDLKFPKSFIFSSTSNKTGGLSRQFVDLPTDPVTQAIVNTLTFDFGTLAGGAVLGQYSWRIENVVVKTKLKYKRY